MNTGANGMQEFRSQKLLCYYKNMAGDNGYSAWFTNIKTRSDIYVKIPFYISIYDQSGCKVELIIKQHNFPTSSSSGFVAVK